MTPKRDSSRKREEGYKSRTNAICVVAYDLGGNPISDVTAAKVINAIYDITKKERLAISFTRS